MADTKNMRFMANNLLEAGVKSITLSSVEDNYLESSLIETQRARTFKFGGRFRIQAGVNDQIKITHSTLGTFQLTVEAGEYKTASALATAITTAINASTTVTCSYSTTTKKFYFEAALSYTIIFTGVTQSIYTTIGVLGNIAPIGSGYTISSCDLPRIHWPCEFIDVDFGYQANAKFIAMIGDASREIKIPEGTLITVRMNNVDNFETGVPVTFTMPWFKSGLFRFLDDLIATGEAYRFVRIEFACPEGPFAPEIGYLYIGEWSSFIDRNISTGIKVVWKDESQFSQSDSGAIYSNDKTPFRIISGLQVGLVKADNINYLKRIFFLHQKSVPFFVCLDPEQFLTEQLDELLVYCRFSSEPEYEHLARQFFEISFELTEAL